jgi:hypothetical protein
MTTTPKDGGPAFPVMHSIDGNWVKTPREEYMGLSLRDYFAAHADISDFDFGNNVDEAAKTLGVVMPTDNSLAEMVKFSLKIAAALRFAQADAMLAAREADND